MLTFLFLLPSVLATTVDGDVKVEAEAARLSVHVPVPVPVHVPIPYPDPVAYPDPVEVPVPVRIPIPVPIHVPYPYPKECVCGTRCTTSYGHTGVCQADGHTCSTTNYHPYCKIACHPPICSTLYCPYEQQQKQYDSHGCELCPICKPIHSSTCYSDADCPAGQECAPGHYYRQCQPSYPTLQRCYNYPTLSGDTRAIADTNSDLGLTGGVDAGLYIGFNRCPPGFVCVNGYCRGCPKLFCAPLPLYCNGIVTHAPLSNGCPSCPRCIPYVGIPRSESYDESKQSYDESKP